MLELNFTPTFRRDLKKLQKKHYSLDALKTVIDLLAEGTHNQELVTRYHDHALAPNSIWKGHHELHVDGKSGDWLLIYQISDNLLTLVRTGSHKTLLGK
ncbi:type II toxin-antitoxin system YafQ family toxin [Agrilactobacillus fermenti]|uniref:type II toxin-antitoxin system YafQ family toxin n=1 Tax=Agrilactobacillus fermenti TaxID=2586909 RepID=UPI001E432CCD|nr:type II toxin-antitoxin system YafQ family toxin [Agrilactobacillus fermenti]MCD2256043.1 type II toxin-antitoxin system YafQ family toxin [Agrilactobacillus fermenti]